MSVWQEYCRWFSYVPSPWTSVLNTTKLEHIRDEGKWRGRLGLSNPWLRASDLKNKTPQQQPPQ